MCIDMQRDEAICSLLSTFFIGLDLTVRDCASVVVFLQGHFCYFSIVQQASAKPIRGFLPPPALKIPNLKNAKLQVLNQMKRRLTEYHGNYLNCSIS